MLNFNIHPEANDGQQIDSACRTACRTGFAGGIGIQYAAFPREQGLVARRIGAAMRFGQDLCVGSRTQTLEHRPVEYRKNGGGFGRGGVSVAAAAAGTVEPDDQFRRYPTNAV